MSRESNHQGKQLFTLLFLTCLSAASFQARTAECDTLHPAWIFCDDFEMGNFSRWTAVYDNTAITNVPNPSGGDLNPTSPPRDGTRVARFRYVIPANAPVHHDDNKLLYLNLIQMTDHLFFRGYVLIPNSTTLYGINRAIQRKLVYFKSNIDPASGSAERPAFGFFLTSEPPNRSAQHVTLRLGYGGPGGVGASLEGIGQLMRGQWTALQVEIKLNSPSTSSETSPKNGIFRLWVDNVLAYEKLDVDYRSNNPNSPQSSDVGKSAFYMLDMVEVGRQADRLEYDPVDEYRYWDDIIVSRQFIPSSAQLRPMAPTLSVQ